MPFAENSPSSPLLFFSLLLLLKSVIIFVCLPLFLLLSSLYSVLFLFLFFTFFFNFKCSPRSESAEGHPEWLLLPPCAGSLAKACKATPAGAPCFAQAL